MVMLPRTAKRLISGFGMYFDHFASGSWTAAGYCGEREALFERGRRRCRWSGRAPLVRPVPVQVERRAPLAWAPPAAAGGLRGRGLRRCRWGGRAPLARPVPVHVERRAPLARAPPAAVGQPPRAPTPISQSSNPRAPVPLLTNQRIRAPTSLSTGAPSPAHCGSACDRRRLRPPRPPRPRCRSFPAPTPCDCGRNGFRAPSQLWL
jgi:hypothetical protein